MITDYISITELARLTRKSRPTMYKYVDDFNKGNYDDIPYSFIKLFRMIGQRPKAEIILYCDTTYGNMVMDECGQQLKELINLIVANQGKLDLTRIKNFITEELNNG